MGGKVPEGGFLAAWCPGKVDEPSQLHGVFLPRAHGWHRRRWPWSSVGRVRLPVSLMCVSQDPLFTAGLCRSTGFVGTFFVDPGTWHV